MKITLDVYEPYSGGCEVTLGTSGACVEKALVFDGKAPATMRLSIGDDLSVTNDQEEQWKRALDLLVEMGLDVEDVLLRAAKNIEGCHPSRDPSPAVWEDDEV